ncbi:MAG TPA: hypothetical protein VFL93_05835 [Longimicrobiaceae bacterium]|jgi:hypothetical protein|nr:hypothetical protein [Longimicrobiaceae bacterium]
MRWSFLHRGVRVLLVVLCAVAARLLVARQAVGEDPSGGAMWAAGLARGGRVGVQAVSPIVLHTDADELDRLALDVVERDPFRQARSRPEGRYHLPGSEPVAATPAPSRPPPPPPRPPLPQLRLVGVVVLGAGKGMAALQSPGAAERVVNVGEAVSGFRLVSVSATEARLSGQDTVLVLHTESPNP